jgi:hypothetical protein
MIFHFKGFFVERPLPSAGLLTFLRTFACEIQNSCYDLDINSNYDKVFYARLRNLSDTLNDITSTLTSTSRRSSRQATSILSKIIKIKKLKTLYFSST